MKRGGEKKHRDGIFLSRILLRAVVPTENNANHGKLTDIPQNRFIVDAVIRCNNLSYSVFP